MYARVARFEGAKGNALREAADDINARSASGPPEGLPAKGLLMLMDPDSGTSLSIVLFETEEDLRKGGEVLEQMTPSGGAGAAQRTSVETYEVGVDLRAP